jgi:predicted nucleic acid-binding protein
MAEGHGWFLRRYDRRRAAQFLAFAAALPDLTVVGFDSAELSKVSHLLVRFGDQNLTLADGHGLVIMQDRQSRVCWSTDRHMALTGVNLAVNA